MGGDKPLTLQELSACPEDTYLQAFFAYLEQLLMGVRSTGSLELTRPWQAGGASLAVFEARKSRQEVCHVTEPPLPPLANGGRCFRFSSFPPLHGRILVTMRASCSRAKNGIRNAVIKLHTPTAAAKI